MTDLLRMTEAASLALHATALLASSPPGKPRSNPDLARSLGASPAHLSKVLQRLTRAGLVRPVRGPAGGFTLARDPGRTTLLDVYEAIDGPLDAPACLLRRRGCQGTCLFGPTFDAIKRRFRDHLAGWTLARLPAWNGKRSSHEAEDHPDRRVEVQRLRKVRHRLR
jgi:Rrf2 family protein